MRGTALHDLILTMLVLSSMRGLFSWRPVLRGPLRRHIASLRAVKDADWHSAKGRTLVIVESPAKAKTIQKFLDSEEYVVDYCAGHIRDLPSAARDVPAEYKKQVVLDAIKLNVADLGVKVHDGFEPIYVPMSGKAEVLRRLKALSKDCTRILLATDEDREGEAISWHLLEVLDPKVPYKRAVFHEITQSAILESFQHPRDMDMDLVHSQETRRILDRLAGYTISPVLWRYIATGLSAGRVQSCGLFLIAQRERKRWDFVESKYFSVRATFLANPPEQSSASTLGDSSVVLESKLFTLDGKKVASEPDFDGATGQLISRLAPTSTILDQGMTTSLLKWLAESCSYSIANLESRKIAKKPPRPFITSTLQQEGSKKLGLSPSRTMSIAQELYEEGYITYMRTDSPFLSTTALGAAKSLVTQFFGDDYLNAAAGQGQANRGKEAAKEVAKENSKKSKKDKEAEKSAAAPMNAQEAHEAIRPAEANGTFRAPDETDLSGQKKVLYSLIYRRTLASVMLPSQSITKTYTIDASSNTQGAHYSSATFRSSHTVRIFDGFQAAFLMDDSGKYTAETKEDRQALIVGQPLWLAGEEDNVSGLLARAGAVSSSVMEEDEEEEDEADKKKEAESEENSTVALSAAGLSGISHVTRAPARFTESSFIKELETIGVGRPSTYSKVFQILRDRGYILVDKQTLVPTITGMVVSNWLEKHFPALVEAKFTALMESSLDQIARGQKDKLDFLSAFYLGSSANGDDSATESDDGDETKPMGVGLLQAVKRKLSNAEIDHKESRSLAIPFLQELGVLQLGRSGAFIESTNDEATLGEKEENNNKRWKLPEMMQLDIRAITRDSVAQLMATETTMQGANMGMDSNGQPVLLRSGRFGRFLQIGGDKDKNKRAHSLPRWVDDSIALDDLLAFSKLPLKLGPHTQLGVPDNHTLYNAQIVLEVNAGSLSVGIDNYPFRIAMPDGLLVSQVTLELAMSLIIDPAPILDSQRVLGESNGEVVLIRKGRFGHYVRQGKLIAGLRKLDPETLTLDEAVALIQTRGKPMGSKKRKSKSKEKATPSKTTTPRRKTAYQLYVSEELKNAGGLAAVAKAWKNLNEPARTVYAERANALPDPVGNVVKEKAVKKKAKSKTKAGEKTSLRRKTGYQLYVSERMKEGVKMAQCAADWKILDEGGKKIYNDKVSEKIGV